jgi:hypothetical protein
LKIRSASGVVYLKGKLPELGLATGHISDLQAMVFNLQNKRVKSRNSSNSLRCDFLSTFANGFLEKVTAFAFTIGSTIILRIEWLNIKHLFVYDQSRLHFVE